MAPPDAFTTIESGFTRTHVGGVDRRRPDKTRHYQRTSANGQRTSANG